MSLWLIGSGTMAQDYAKVLKNLGKEFEVIGRSAASAKKFEEKTGYFVKQGGLDKALLENSAPQEAIIAVGVEQLAAITIELIRAGVHRILVEKPGGLNSSEIRSVAEAALKNKTDIFLAYNRRFYASIKMAQKLIAEDGGATSCYFEFTEWSHVIGPSNKGEAVKRAWFLANSSHVVDLAFFLCGFPRDWQAWHGGSLNWHSAASRFCGSGITEQGIFFSYLADWEAPGRWGLEVLTRKRRYIFRPLEQLHFVALGSVQIEKVEIDDKLDKEFKPGLYEQTRAFLDKETNYFCSIEDQLKHCSVFDKMAGYSLQQ